MDSNTVDEVMALLPDELTGPMRENANGLPVTDEEWAAWLDIYIETAEWPPDLTDEQFNDIRLEHKNLTRKGVEAVRDYFKRHAA